MKEKLMKGEGSKESMAIALSCKAVEAEVHRSRRNDGNRRVYRAFVGKTDVVWSREGNRLDALFGLVLANPRAEIRAVVNELATIPFAGTPSVEDRGNGEFWFRVSFDLDNKEAVDDWWFTVGEFLND